MLCLAFLSACSSTHQGTKSMNVEGLSLEARPLQTSVVAGEKISGTVECTNFLGIPFVSPAKEAYGARLETTDGNFAGDKCTRGAIYNAIVSSGADVIIAPQYMTEGKTFLCLPWIGCLYNNRKITVIGYKGTYSNIRDMSEYVIEKRFTSGKGQGNTGKDRLSKFFNHGVDRGVTEIINRM